MSTDHGTVFSQPRDQGPLGLCGDRGQHLPHLYESATLGRFWCTADQSHREPFRSERRRVTPDLLAHGNQAADRG